MMNVFVERFGWVLIHSLWQFGLIGLLAGIAVRAMRHRSASGRYLVLVGLMAFSTTTPAITWCWQPVPVQDLEFEQEQVNMTRSLSETFVTEDDVNDTRALMDEPIVSDDDVNGHTPQDTAAMSDPVAESPFADNPLMDWSHRLAESLRPWFKWIVAGWSIGVVLCSLRPLLGWRTLGRLKRIGVSPVSDEIRSALVRVSTQLGVKRKVEVLLSALAQVPVVVGYFKPVILLPVSFAMSIPTSQIEAILAHELAHVRRHDFIVNLLQTLIETLCFYHPAIWWMSRQIRIEREHCCDDLVVGVFQNRVEYGRALIAVEELRGRQGVLALGMADGSLLSRVRRIVGVRVDRSDAIPAGRWPVALVGVAMMGFVLKLAVGSTASEQHSVDSPVETAATELPDDTGQSSSSETESVGDKDRFSAEFADGRSVEIVGMTKNTRPANEGWRPDGRAIGDVGYWRSTIVLHNRNTSAAYTENGEHPEPDDDALDFLFRFRGLQSQPSITFELPSNGTSFHHWPVADPYEIRVSTRLRGSPPPGGKWNTADGVVRVGFTDAPWGEWLHVSPEGQVLNPLTADDLYHAQYEQIRIDGISPHERTPNKQVLVLVQPKGRSSLYDFQIRGIDADGKSQWVLQWEGQDQTDTERHVGRWGLSNTESKPLVRYEFRLRPYQHWGTFQNVSLQVGQETNVISNAVSLPLGDPAPVTVPDKAAVPQDPLHREVSLSADNLQLKSAVQQIAKQAGLELEYDAALLNQNGLDLDQLVSTDLQNLQLKQAIWKLVSWEDHPGFMFEVRHGKLVLTTIQARQARTHSLLPEWLKPHFGHGLLATLNEDDQVIKITSSDTTDDLLAQIKNLPYLSELEISGSANLTEVGLACLSEMPRLKRLSAASVNREGRALGDEIIRHLIPVSSLRELAINECGTTNAGAKLLEQMPQLTSLNFYQEGKLTDDALKSIRRLSKLKHLSLITYVGTERFGWMRFSIAGTKLLSRLKNLESLQLVGHEVSAEMLEFPKLKSLGLGNSSVDDTVAAKIGELQDLQNLELSYCEITDAGMKLISALPKLYRLDISSSRITDAGIEHFRTQSNLSDISLRVGNLSDSSLLHLAQIKSITALSLYGSGQPGVRPGRNFSMAGLLQLKRLPNLRTLSLTNFDIPGGGYDSLKEFSNLHELTMLMCNASDAELDSLELAMPHTRISHMTGGFGWQPKKQKQARMTNGVVVTNTVGGSTAVPPAEQINTDDQPAVSPNRVLRVELDIKFAWCLFENTADLKPKMKFRVREAKKSDDQPDVIKGTIEVTRILSEKMAEVRILHEEANHTLAKGDEVMMTHLTGDAASNDIVPIDRPKPTTINQGTDDAGPKADDTQVDATAEETNNIRETDGDEASTAADETVLPMGSDEPINPKLIAWGKRGEDQLSIGLILRPKRDKYQYGELVQLRLYVRNDGQQPVECHFANSRFPQAVDFIVTDETGAKVDVRSGHENWNVAVNLAYSTDRIPPGQILELRVPFELSIGDDPSTETVGRIINAHAGQALKLRLRTPNEMQSAKETGVIPESGVISFTVTDGSKQVDAAESKQGHLSSPISIRGRVTIDGPIPRVPPLKVKMGLRLVIPRNEEEQRENNRRERNAVATEIPDDSLILSEDGGVANVAIYLKKAPEGWDRTDPPDDAINIRSADNRFHPRMTLMRVGQPLKLISPKSESENFLFQPVRSNVFNILVPPDSTKEVKSPFTLSESFPASIASNIHPWQKAYLLGLDHPFAAITDAQGKFEIPGLPAGEHHFTVWHELRGYLNKDLVVRVDKDQVTEVNLKYRAEQLQRAKRVQIAGNPGTNFDSIQAAIDAASEGASIQIGEGQFDERLNITKRVTLIGRGTDKTILGPTLEGQIHRRGLLEKKIQNLESGSLTDEERADPKKVAQSLEGLKRSYLEPILQMKDVAGVELRSLRVTMPDTPEESRGGPSTTAILVDHAGLTMTDCAVIGCQDTGIQAKNGSDLSINDSLIAGVWGTGVAVFNRSACRLSILNSEIRNCYHNNIWTGPLSSSCVIEGCKISGSAWFGIRYGDKSPVIKNNAIFENARAGVYAEGDEGTIKNNLFYKNANGGIGVYFSNKAMIEHNVFLSNNEAAIWVNGNGEPTIRHNLLAGTQRGVSYGPLMTGKPNIQPTGKYHVQDNLLWNVDHPVVLRIPLGTDGSWSDQSVKLDENTGNKTMTAKLSIDSDQQLQLEDSSSIREWGLDEVFKISMKSKWPLTPEEKSMIPNDGTRHSTNWKMRPRK